MKNTIIIFSQNLSLNFIFLSLIIIFLLIDPLFSQKTNIFNVPEADYITAYELFNKEKYGSARTIFNKIAENPANTTKRDLVIAARYYEAICAVELFNPDAENKIMSFIYDNPENSTITQAWFHLAIYDYRKKNYRKALKAFDNVDVYLLNEKDKAEYFFKTGYCYFVTNNYEAAKSAFYELLDKESKYKSPVNYFYAHIAYIEKNYETALIKFQSLINDPDFAPIVPYYITQIYYVQGKYDELLKVAPGLLDSASTKRTPEIARLIGEAYYKKGQFEKALPYLEMYKTKTTSTITKDDYYQLGYAYYKTKNYEKALDYFKKVTDAQDTLSQNAWQMLADCYLKTGEKIFARNAFLSAYKLKLDRDITENALFNYAKLSYELSINPYNEAINALQLFINDYPNSIYIDDANTYLSELYMSTKNYKDALKSIENIKIKNEKISTAWQKVAYFRAIELFNDKKFNEALPLFNKAAKMRYNKNYSALSLFWQGEIYYRLNKIDSALSKYNAFLLDPAAYNLPEFNLVHYNIGYCYFNKKNYSQAIIPFQKFLLNKTDDKQEIINDTYKRIADCYFMNKNLNSAIEYYDKSIATNLSGTDYSLFQKAIALGVLKKYNEKIDVLNKLTVNYPKSNYLDDAIYELAETYMVLNDNKKSLDYFSQLIDNFPQSSYVSKSKTKRGLLYFNMKEDEIALKELKEVVTLYAGTPESKEALVTIQDIYIYMNKVDEFLVYVKDIKSVSNIEEDSITYQAIEYRYMKGDCENARTSFTNYINTFSNGIFLTNAYFYRAECDYKAAALEQALEGYDYVISKPRNKFTESALLKASSITFTQKNYELALQYFLKLEQLAEYDNNIIEARKGIMRCYFELQQFENAISAATKLLETPKVNEDKILTDEANMIIAKSALKLGNIPKAQTMFNLISKESKGESKAEAKYYLAEIQYNLKNYDESQKEIFELINQVPSYDKWIARGFILLADNYFVTGNPFEAKQTLQAVIDNYKGTDLVEIAYAKLNAIIDSEKPQQTPANDNDSIPEDLNHK